MKIYNLIYLVRHENHYHHEIMKSCFPAVSGGNADVFSQIRSIVLVLLTFIIVYLI
jgi:hypothetical protein